MQLCEWPRREGLRNKVIENKFKKAFLTDSKKIIFEKKNMRIVKKLLFWDDYFCAAAFLVAVSFDLK